MLDMKGVAFPTSLPPPSEELLSHCTGLVLLGLRAGVTLSKGRAVFFANAFNGTRQ